MSRPGVLRLSRLFSTGPWGRLGAWLGVVALVAQLLAPLSQPQAAWAENGLFPPSCSVHLAGDGGANLPDMAECSQCPLCQLHAGDRLLFSPVRQAEPAFAVPLPPVFPDAAQVPSRAVAAHSPLPSRGPPSVA